MAIAGDAFVGKIDHLCVSAVGIVMLGEVAALGKDGLPEAGGLDVFGTVQDIIRLTGIFPWYQIVSPNALSIDSGEPEEEELQIQYTPQLSPERFDFGVQGFC